MKAIDARQRGRHRDPILTGLAAGTRRGVLAELRAAGTSIAERELARLVGSGESSGSAAGSHRIEEIRTQLHHVHLPKLAAADLIEWKRHPGAVRLADTQLVEDAALWEVVDAGEDVDEVLQCLADPVACAVLSTLRDAGGRMDRPRLAAKLVRHDPIPEHSSDAFEQVVVSLRHHQLPTLADAGLVREANGTVVATGDDRLATVWPLVERLANGDGGEDRY